MGRRRRSASDLDGVLIVDKPAGPTSHDVVQAVRRVLGQHRVGHTGTLDPPATGVLVVCLGRAAKLVPYLQAGRKTYAARMVLGIETDTQDATGTAVATTSADHIDEQQLCEALGRFQGTIAQVPPMVSAVRVDGERLHARARRGEDLEREPRQVTVHTLVLDGFVPGTHPEASFLVTCSAGTYVRTLAHDVGRDLGVGASLRSLRRVANGPFTVDEAHVLDAIVHADRATVHGWSLAPVDAVCRALPSVTIEDPDQARRLTQGGRLPEGLAPHPTAVLHAGLLLGIYRDERGAGRPSLVWTRPEELDAARGAPPDTAPPDAASPDAAPSAPSPAQQPHEAEDRG